LGVKVPLTLISRLCRYWYKSWRLSSFNQSNNK